MISVDIVLFDLGNTLLYDRPASWPRTYRRAEVALWRSLRKNGVRIDPAGLYGKHTSLLSYYYALRGEGLQEPGTMRILGDLLRQHGQPIDQAVARDALDAMYAVTQGNWRVERGASSVLNQLSKRGFRIGAVSNGSDHENALELLRKARLTPYFEIVVTSANQGIRKPDPSIFEAALSHFGAEPGHAVMIGDSYEADVIGAHRLGIHSIWLDWQGAPAPGAVSPDATIRRLTDVPAQLERRPAPIISL